jgi:hypothetical protein
MGIVCCGQHAGCGCAIIGGDATTPWHGFQVAHGAGHGAAAASGAAIGVTYCGIGAATAGGHTGAAATGAAYTGAGGQAAPRLNQLHGQHGHSPSPGGQQAAQPPNVTGIVATASKVSIFFMANRSPHKAVGDYCLGGAV